MLPSRVDNRHEKVHSKRVSDLRDTIAYLTTGNSCSFPNMDVHTTRESYDAPSTAPGVSLLETETADGQGPGRSV